MKGKILVVYFSKTGRTEKVSKTIASELNADIEKIIDLNPRNYFIEGMAAGFKKEADIKEPEKKPADYDYVIIGTPVWAWNMTPAVRTYITKFKGSFKNLAFFTTAGGTEPKKIVEDMESLAGQKGVGFTGFVDSDFKDSAKVKKKLDEFLRLFVE